MAFRRQSRLNGRSSVHRVEPGWVRRRRESGASPSSRRGTRDDGRSSPRPDRHLPRDSGAAVSGGKGERHARSRLERHRQATGLMTTGFDAVGTEGAGSTSTEVGSARLCGEGSRGKARGDATRTGGRGALPEVLSGNGGRKEGSKMTEPITKRLFQTVSSTGGREFATACPFGIVRHGHSIG